MEPKKTRGKCKKKRKYLSYFTLINFRSYKNSVVRHPLDSINSGPTIQSEKTLLDFSLHPAI